MIASYYPNIVKEEMGFANVEDFLGEACLASIRINGGHHALIGSVYLPPHLDSDCSSLSTLFTAITKTGFDVKIIAGDVNKPDINWTINKSLSCCLPFLNSMNYNGWSQVIHEPTRNSNILDLVFTLGISPTSIFTKCNSFTSDHKGVQCLLPISSTLIKNSGISYTDFNSADPANLNNFVRTID